MSELADQVSSAQRSAATLAEVARERRDVVSGASMGESRLVRFVEGPDGFMIPDLGRKLPGRGVWVAADRGSVARARERMLFARALHKAVQVAEDVEDHVETLMLARLLSALGLARKAGVLKMGFEKTQSAVLSGNAALLIEAIDGASDGRRKVFDARRRSPSPPRLIGLFGSAELGLALGVENVVHIAFLAGRGAERWSIEVDRLAGFRPLCPADWNF